jgi:uncharacterized DUF497 family protein
MRFEFDPAKSAANKEKHGIDFVEAQALWDDEHRVIVEGRSAGELRFGMIGIIAAKHWTAFFTVRGVRLRLISVRRARPSEVKKYEQEMGLR